MVIGKKAVEFRYIVIAIIALLALFFGYLIYTSLFVNASGKASTQAGAADTELPNIYDAIAGVGYKFGRTAGERISGAIGDPSKVICFGGGSDHYVRCLTKEHGNQVFGVGSGTSWALQDAKSTPTLTKDAIYFGLGQYFCAYGIDGNPLWGCKKFDQTIPTGVAVDETKDIACFGGGADHTVHCVQASSGLQKFSVHGGWTSGTGACPNQNDCIATSTPTISGDYVYFGLGNRVCRYKTDSAGTKEPASDGSAPVSGNAAGNWCSAAFPHTIETGVALNAEGDKVCFGGGADSVVRCLNTADGSEIFRAEGSGNAKSTPELVGNNMYFSIGKQLCKYDFSRNLNEIAVPGGDAVWCAQLLSEVPTGISVNEQISELCFGGGADHTVHCLRTDMPVETRTIHAGKWGSEVNAMSTPFLENDNYVYTGIGNRVVKVGYTTYDFSKLVCDGQENSCRWLYNFDDTIPTGIATYSGA